MKKIKLQLEELAVESFATAPPPLPAGTVHARDTLPNTHCVSCYWTVCETECSCLVDTYCCTPDTECCLTPQAPCPEPTHYATCIC